MGVCTVISLIDYSISTSLLIVLWVLQLVPWLQMPISGDEENSNCWPTSPTPQQEQKGMNFPGRREDEGVKGTQSHPVHYPAYRILLEKESH